MKMSISTLAALAATLLFASQANSAVKVRFYKGRPTYISITQSSVVQIAPPPASKDKQPAIAVIVLNRSDRAASIGYENVTIRTVTGTPAQLVTYEELQRKARQRAGWATFFAILAAGANSYAAQQSAYGTGYGSAYTSTPYGGIHTTYATSYYSPIAGQLALDRAEAQNGDMFRAISNQLDATMARLDGAVLRTTTIDPGDSFGGAVVVKLPKGAKLSDLVVSVSFRGEIHEFALGGDPSLLEQMSSSDLESRQTSAMTPQAAPATATPVPAIEPDAPRPTAAPPEDTTASNSRGRRRSCGLVVVTDPSQVTCRR
jgi:hypothetical protein